MPRLRMMHKAGAGPILALVLGFAASAPGQDAIPRAGLELWIRADSVKVQDGKVTQLYDMSGKNNHPTHETLAGMDPLSPALVKNAHNGHPTLRFNPNFTGFAFSNIANIRTVIAVLSKDSTSCLPTLPNYKTPAKFFLGQGDGITNFHPEHGCSLYNANLSEVSPLLVNGKTFINGKAVADGRKAWFPFRLGLVTMLPTGNVKASTIARDRTMKDRSWQGDISEILIWNLSLDNAARLAVESFLMAKYNINGTVGLSEGRARGAASRGGTGSGIAFILPQASGVELSFAVPAAGRAGLTVLDWRGRRIRTVLEASLASGPHVAQWDGTDESGRRAASGVYVAELRFRDLAPSQHRFFLR